MDSLTLKVARLVVAAAWADGTIQPVERAYLRKRFQEMPYISGADWVSLNDDLDTPMTSAERGRAVQEVVDAVATDDQKRFVLDTIGELVAADGVVTGDELALLDALKTALDGKPVGILPRVTRILSALVRRPCGP